jgi:hypothetical protein
MSEKQETTNLSGELSIPFDLDDSFKWKLLILNDNYLFRIR